MQDFSLGTHVIAHRGASAYAPENTMISFVKAAQCGATWVEFDVKLAGDGTAIVFHDEILDRTTNGKGCVNDFTYSYLQTLDAGAWFNPAFSGERIPTFRQVLQFLFATGMNANIEIKPGPDEDAETVQAIMQEIKQWLVPPYNTILFSSFSLSSLQLLRQQAPESRIGFLMHEWVTDWRQICTDLQAATVNVNHEILTPERAKEVKSTKRGLLCYTVNDPDRAQELYRWGVDAVFSDGPDRIMGEY